MRIPTQRRKWLDNGPFETLLVEYDPARLLGGVTLDQIIDLLDPSYNLTYIDYRDNLNDSLSTLQTCIQEGNRDALYELTDDWFNDAEYDSVAQILTELQETVADQDDWWDEDWLNDDPYHYDNLHNGLTCVFEDYSDWLRDAVFGRDSSTPLDDLLRNTSEVTLHYRTGYEVANNDGYNEQSEVWAFKKFLGIKKKDTTWDKQIQMVMAQASYGGQLIIFFMDDAKRWIDPFDPKIDTIKFKNPHICIWDGWNGSGDDTILDGFELTLPFDRTNLYIDETCHYNYSQDVCGMVHGFCSGTEVSLSHSRKRKHHAKVS